jgi:hypothetical protein
MKKILALAALLVPFAAHAYAQQAVYYQIDLAPSGKLLAKDKPVIKAGAYVFRSYPSGTLTSLRASQIKYITPLTVDTSDPTYRVIAIGNLAMQGGSTQAGRTNASALGAKPAPKGPELGEGFYSDLKMGETLAPDAAASGDYQIGRTYAYAPSSATQSSPGSPPTNPGLTSGANPPTMSSTADGTNPQ